jgi:hypothetical protein
MKTLQECKDEAAVSYGYKSIDEMFVLLGDHQIKNARHSQLFGCLDKASDLHTQHLQQTLSRYTNQEIQLSNYAYQMDLAKRDRDKAEEENERLRAEKQSNAELLETLKEAFETLESLYKSAYCQVDYDEYVMNKIKSTISKATGKK